MDEKSDGRVLIVEKLHKKARYLRGKFLNSVAVIERDISIILTEYFCKEDEVIKELFYGQIAEKFSLQKKKEMLIEIVKNDYPGYWEENKEVLNNLLQIQKFRNKLAHSVIDVSDEALERYVEEGVSFVQWRKGEPVSDNEFNDFEVKANMVMSTLMDIKRLLPYKETAAVSD